MSLVRKLVLWFSLVVVGALLILYITISSIITTNNERTLDKDMLELKENSETYLMRVMQQYSIPITPEGFAEAAPMLGGDLEMVLGIQFCFYDTQGNILFGEFDEEDGYVPQEDLSYALEGKSAYTVVLGKRTDVYFSYPATMDGEMLGIIRVEKDYTALYENGNYMLNMVLVSGIGVMSMALLLLVVAMANVIRPVNRLSAAIDGLTISPRQAQLIPVRRQDEVGELTRKYNRMAETIKEQWITIQRERDTLRKTLQYRKKFYDNITHELKTPLTIILGYGEMMQQTNLEDEDFNRRGVEQIVVESKRLCEMVAGLLEVSRSSQELQDDYRRVSITSLLETLVNAMGVRAQRYGIQLCLEAEQDFEVLGSQEKLRQLFVNLLDNAIKYGVSGSVVGITVRREGQTAKISVTNEIEGKIDERELDKLFLPYYRASSEEGKEKGSVGLGLALCKSIAEAHGGDIQAEMIGEQTICFIVEIPLDDRRGDEQ